MTEYDSLRLRPWRLSVDASTWQLLSATGERLGGGRNDGWSWDARVIFVLLGWDLGSSPTCVCPGVYEWPLTPEEESIVDEQVEIDKVDEWARSRARAEDTP